MLKRQRPLSPPPSTPLIPLVESPVYNSKSKRRRTMPPSLDGQSRGWAKELSCDEHSTGGDSSQEFGATSSSEQPSNLWHYKLTNTMLHELHTLQQDRVLLSLPLLPPTTSGSSLSSASLPNFCISSTMFNPNPKIMTPRQDQISQMTDYSDKPNKDPTHPAINTQNPTEELRVKERYEDTNRSCIMHTLITIFSDSGFKVAWVPISVPEASIRIP
ncbi:hypothetical protein BDZ94DRAFT_1277730 [Collybia nuda]|uniref:Uncharacterized protein n=1 Tax=Collybia nuda TaxID=64659 RepID=A0A9P6CC39_9AGAR|nr:hypothetical protein BDZ94DRAFT_1277730 [Collybia nuda]